MPRTCIDTADAIEPAETLQLIAGWLAADPGRLAASLLTYIGHPANGPDTLRADLDRFTFLLGGSDGEVPPVLTHPALDCRVGGGAFPILETEVCTNDRDPSQTVV